MQARLRPIREAIRTSRTFCQVRLRVPRELESLPWESLHDSTLEGFLATSERFSIIREVAEDLPPPPDRRAPGPPVGILLVLPEGSGLDLGRERELIARRAADRGPDVRLEVLDGRITPDRLAEAIGRGPWDIVHFGGHADTNPAGEVVLRLNAEGDAPAYHWMEAEVFASLFNNAPARLVVLNCCRGASVYRARGLSGLGPFLLRKGVPAVVAMRYDLPDPLAVRFADEFYRVLLGGPEPGRVDLAVEGARAVVYRNQTEQTVRGFITPILYLLAEGSERPFALGPPARSPIPPPPPPGLKQTPVTIPDRLIGALRERKCVPVIGPGLLALEALRSAPPPPGPRVLARKLAERSAYPLLAADFALVEQAGTWMDSLVLQWVCQHFNSLEEIQDQLFTAIEECFRPLKPSESLKALATWDVPGYLCTYFDGLLQQAIQEQSRVVQVLNAVQAATPPEPGVPLLVHLRGAWTDDRSLVLTEDEHNDLWDRIGNLPTHVTELVHASPGRSLLVLGAHPRDPLLRRLVSRLIPPETARRVGPVFFACERPTEADEAYWSRFKVQWLRDPLDRLIDALNAALGREVRG